MSKARLIITAVVVEGRSPSEVARSYGVARSWVYTLVARYRAEGDTAFEPRSRRPRTRPGVDHWGEADTTCPDFGSPTSETSAASTSCTATTAPYYIGVARDRGIGDRLKDHRHDQHEGYWDRFSWFGFRRVLARRDPSTGLHDLAAPATTAVGSVNEVIADMEALLIKAMGTPFNLNEMNFPNGEGWEQVIRLDEAGVLDRAGVLTQRRSRP